MDDELEEVEKYPGTPVVLKSGGPVMCVTELRDKEALCNWTAWDEDFQVTVSHSAWFSITSLYEVSDFNPIV